MAITLKNITAGDTISSMVDKINFNFDQLILNGGGIQGPKGDDGYTGMQGTRGEQGLRGPKGETGERGTVIHILDRYGNGTAGKPSVERAISEGLLEGLTPMDCKEGDIIIALADVADDSGNGSPISNYINSIWDVVWREADNNYFPENGRTLPYNEFFEEIATSNGNSLLRTIKNNSKARALILNDCNGNVISQIIDGVNYTISDNLINEIANNNIAVVYTEATSQENSSSSPNGGIVFFQNNTDDDLNDYPRINYAVKSDNSVKQLNICATQQSIEIHAGKSLQMISENGTFSCRINKGENVQTAYEMYYYDEDPNASSEKETFIALNWNNSGNTKYAELHLSAKEIFFDNEYSRTNDTDYIQTWLTIKDKNYSEPNKCEITFCKDDTYVAVGNIFTIGKPGHEFKPTNDPTGEEEFFNQSRILLTNGENNPHIDIITPELYIGRDPVDDTYSSNYGMVITKGTSRILVQSTDTNNHTDKIKVVFDTTSPYKSKVLLEATYPGVIDFSNVSERYEACIINYAHSNVDNSHKFYTSPMGDVMYKPNRNNYSNCNFYNAMTIRNVNNMGAVHSGTIVYTDNYNGTIGAGNLMYNFVRVGNVVHCTFNGIINTNKICSREFAASNSNLAKDTLANGETRFRSTTRVITTWPQSSSYKNTGRSYMPNINNEAYKNTSYQSEYIKFVSVSLNNLYVNLYPPVIGINKFGNSYYTGVTHLRGHLTLSSNGGVYEKELSYNDTIVPSGVNLFKIPSIQVRNMKSHSSDTAGDLIISGTTTTKYAEISGYFSYILNIPAGADHGCGVKVEKPNVSFVPIYSYSSYMSSIIDGDTRPDLNDVTGNNDDFTFVADTEKN